MRRRMFGLILVGCVALAGPGLSRADVIVFDTAPRPTTMIMHTLTDDSDPVGSNWNVILPPRPGSLLGSGGPPDVVWQPGSGWPVAVWAAPSVIQHDVFFSEWTASGWSAIEPLTSTMGNELDPRVFVEPDGTLHVVWWTTGSPGDVYLVTRPAGSTTWSAPTRVNSPGESPRRPSVAMNGGEIWVAYERDSPQPDMTQEVVAAHRLPNGEFVHQIVAATSRTDRLDVMPHVVEGLLWIDWKHTDEELGCSELEQASWSGVGIEPWLEPTWVGVEAARKAIREQVLGP